MTANLSADVLAPPLDDIETMGFAPASKPFTDAGWTFELMPDGYRMLGECGGSGPTGPRLHSRAHIDTTGRFPEIAAALAEWAAPHDQRLVLDGVICALDAGGLSEPARLHRRGTCIEPNPADGELVYVVFDILVGEGVDLRSLPWAQRRTVLESLPWRFSQQGTCNGTLRLLNSVRGEGSWLYRQAMALGRSGIAAKRRASAYQGGVSNDWRWIPCSSGVRADGPHP